MSILLRLALNCGLLCAVWHAAFPGLPLPIPGYGDPFMEAAFFVLIAVVIHEFWSCWRASRGSNDDDGDEK